MIKMKNNTMKTNANRSFFSCQNVVLYRVNLIAGIM